MKKITVAAIIFVLLLTCTNAISKAIISSDRLVVDSARNTVFVEAKNLLVRLDDINAMDKTAMSKGEKKQLRKEAHAIKSQLKELDKGTYLSVRTIGLILLVPVMIFTLMQ